MSYRPNPVQWRVPVDCLDRNFAREAVGRLNARILTAGKTPSILETTLPRNGQLESSGPAGHLTGLDSLVILLQKPFDTHRRLNSSA